MVPVAETGVAEESAKLATVRSEAAVAAEIARRKRRYALARHLPRQQS